MTQPATDETERAEAAQAALAESLERAHELVSEARFMLRPHDTDVSDPRDEA